MSHFFRLHHAEPEDDLVFLEIRRPVEVAAPETLPDWLDLVLCVVAPVLVAALVLLVFYVGSLVSAGG